MSSDALDGASSATMGMILMGSHVMRRWYDRIRGVLKDRKMTYEEVGKALGVTKGAVGHWLTGTVEIPTHRAKALAKLLDMDLVELIGDDPYIFRNEQEKRVLDAWRAADPQDRELALAILARRTTQPEPAESD